MQFYATQDWLTKSFSVFTQIALFIVRDMFLFLLSRGEGYADGWMPMRGGAL